MEPVTSSVTIGKPRDEVFAYLADIANHAEFMDALFREWHLLRVDSYGRGAGASFRATGRLDRFGWGNLTFAEVDVPSRILAVGEGGKYNRIKTECEWTLDADGPDSTRVNLSYRTDPPLPTDRIMETMAGRRAWFKRGARKSLGRLRTILEDGANRGTRATVAGL